MAKTKKVQKGTPVGGYDPNMLHRLVAQNAYDMAPYVKHGTSRTKKGRSK